MADHTKIEWTDATWNPVTGCSVVSPGCTNCYAMRLAGARMQHHPSRAGLTVPSAAGPVWNGIVRLNEQWLDQPFHWRRPRRIFVCAHGDLFHEAVPDDWIDRVFAIMALCPQHIFQVLTKRAARMRDYLSSHDVGARWALAVRSQGSALPAPALAVEWTRHGLPNVWAGVSAENQRLADERIPLLLETPAAVRWISAEPLLGSVRLREALGDDWLASGKSGERLGLHWVVCGGESGPAARPMLASWARSLRDQCAAAGVPFFFKQWGEWIDADHWLDGLYAGFQRGGNPWKPTRPLNFTDAGWLAEASGRAGAYEHQSDGTTMIRVGKRSAGRMLDGREWSEFPA